MPNVFTVTYDIVTPESAEHGDAEEIGFVHANGGQDELSIVPMGAEDYKMGLREALSLMGGMEDGGSGESFYETDGRQNYQTGAETRYAFHIPRTVTVSSRNRIVRLLKKERLL
jgi:hypothetical protein